LPGADGKVVKMSGVKKVDGFLKKMGDLGPLNEDCFCILIQGNAKVRVSVREEDDLLIVASPLLSVPERDLLPFFRELLTLNFKETADAAFALDDEADRVELHIKRPLDKLDYEEFERAVKTVAEVADRYNDVLAEEFGAKLEPVEIESSKLRNYLELINPINMAEAAQRAQSRNRHWGTFLYLVGLAVAIAGAFYVHWATDSWALGIFVYIWAFYIIGRALPSLIADPQKGKRIIYFGTFPAIATGVLFLVQWIWGIWWLSVLLGCLAGWFLGAIILVFVMPKIVEEEGLEDQERLKRWFGGFGSLKRQGE
jgi:hypothetical protein